MRPDGSRRFRFWTFALLVATILTVLIPAGCVPAPLKRTYKRLIVDSPDFSQKGIPEDLLITFDTGGCWGTCPDFKVSIDSKGTVVFEGRRYTKTREAERYKISESEIRSLLSAFEVADYFTFENEYSEDKNCFAIRTSHSWITTSIRFDGMEHSVRHYTGCMDSADEFYPEDLHELENAIVELSGARRFFKSEQEAREERNKELGQD